MTRRTALAIADRLGRGEMALARYDAAWARWTPGWRSCGAARDALRRARAGAAGAISRRWAAAGTPPSRTSAALLAMALRGRKLVVGPADPADRTDVTRRVSVTDAD